MQGLTKTKSNSTLKRGGPIKKKPISEETVAERRENTEKMKSLFQQVWDTKPHKSEVSGTYLGKELKSIYCHL